MNINEIVTTMSQNVHQKGSSQKDEITLARTMMNNPNLECTVYNKDGTTYEKTPGQDFRAIVSRAIASVTNISSSEAAGMMQNYEFSKQDGSAMVGFIKSYLPAYLRIGRSFPLDTTANSSVTLYWSEIPERTTLIPTKSGERVEKKIPAHAGVKAKSPAPSWVK